MNPLLRSFAYLVFGVAAAGTGLLIALIVRHEHRAGLARIRRASR